MLRTMPRKPPTPPPGPAPEPKPDRHKNTVVSFRPSPEMREYLQSLADTERRSVAQIIEFLIEEAKEAREKKKREGE